MFKKRRDKIAEAAEELSAHLRATDHIKALQEGQKLLADEISNINQRLDRIESNLKEVGKDAVVEALREAQTLVSRNQDGIYERLSKAEIHIDRMVSGRSLVIDQVPKSIERDDIENS